MREKLGRFWWNERITDVPVADDKDELSSHLAAAGFAYTGLEVDIFLV